MDKMVDMSFIYTVHVCYSKLTFSSSTIAAGKASQTTPVQIAHVFMLCCTTQIMPPTVLIPVNLLLHGMY